MFEKGTTIPVRVGDWICFNSTRSDGSDAWEHCKVIETHLFPVIKVTVPISKQSPETDAAATAKDIIAATPKPPKYSSAAFDDVTFYKYDFNFDNLDESQKRGAIVAQLDLLPSVK